MTVAELRRQLWDMPRDAIVLLVVTATPTTSDDRDVATTAIDGCELDEDCVRLIAHLEEDV